MAARGPVVAVGVESLPARSDAGVPIVRIAVAVVLLLPSLLHAQSTTTAPMIPATASKPATGKITNAEAQAAINKGVAYLYTRQERQGSISSPHSGQYPGGAEALVVLALLSAGESPDDPRIVRTLNYLRVQQGGQTYTRSLRVMLYSMLTNGDWRTRMLDDVQWLIKQQDRNGGWGYGPTSTMNRLRPDWTDGSNTHFALLALNDAVDAGAPVASAVWKQAELFWHSLQNEDGGWGYQPPLKGQAAQRPLSHGSMTVAGIDSYLIMAQRQPEEKPQPRKRRFGPAAPAAPDAAGNLAYVNQIDRGTSWMNQNFRLDQVPKFIYTAQPSQLNYYLYTLQLWADRAGLHSLGGGDHSMQIAAGLRDRQLANGSWDTSAVDTALAVLALTRARSPIVVNRLSPEGGSGHDALAAANIARWFTRWQLRPCSWQQITPDTAEGLADCPLLYVDAASGGSISDNLGDRLVQYVRNGGTLLIQAAEKKAGDMTKRLGQLFPDYQKLTLAPDHPIFNIQFKIVPEHQPSIEALGDLCRARIFVLADPVSQAWHNGDFKDDAPEFELAANLVHYSAGGGMPAGRLVGRADVPPAPPASRSIPVARLKHAGDYNVCPLAIRRLSDRLAYSLSQGLKELPAVDAGRPIAPSQVHLLWLTGNLPPKLSPAEVENVRQYLSGGGTLLIDSAIGKDEFRTAAMQLMGELFGQESLTQAPADCPLLTGNFAGGIGANLAKSPAGSTPASRPAEPQLHIVTQKGRIVAVLAGKGLTCSVEGNPCVENAGYPTELARNIALNVILYATAGQN